MLSWVAACAVLCININLDLPNAGALSTHGMSLAGRADLLRCEFGTGLCLQHVQSPTWAGTQQTLGATWPGCTISKGGGDYLCQCRWPGLAQLGQPDAGQSSASHIRT